MTPAAPGIKLTLKELAAVPPCEEAIALVEQVLSGSREAQARFYETFRPMVQECVRKWNARHFRPFGLRPLDEEDDTQHVLMRLIYGDRLSSEYRQCESPLKSWLDYDGPRRKSLKGFVLRSVELYLRDLRRGENPLAVGEYSHNPGNPGDDFERSPDGVDPLTIEERSHLRRCSSMCWQRLHPAHQQMLELAGVMGYSQSEAAQRLGISEATASRWLREAIKQFRTCLEENCPEELLPFATKAG
jgi:RNA polymerase sigma factor (sigma-70 family)